MWLKSIIDKYFGRISDYLIYEDDLCRFKGHTDKNDEHYEFPTGDFIDWNRAKHEESKQ